MRSPAQPRGGFSLAEILVALAILGIIGASMTKVLLNQNRFFDKQSGLRTARGISRSAMNVLLSDLRMVQDSGGVDAVSLDGKSMSVMVPYRFGLVCGTNNTMTTVSMLPVDSGALAMSVYRGFAFRNTSGRYTYELPVAPTGADAPATATSPSTCTSGGGAQITTVAMNGRQGSILDVNAPTATGAAVATPVFFFQRVTYSFRTSAAYPAYLGLWRDVDGSGSTEELMAPFDTTAGFRFYTAGAETAQSTPPALANIRGVDILLYAVSPKTSSNSASATTSKMVTSVFFKSVRSY